MGTSAQNSANSFVSFEYCRQVSINLICYDAAGLNNFFLSRKYHFIDKNFIVIFKQYINNRRIQLNFGLWGYGLNGFKGDFSSNSGGGGGKVLTHLRKPGI